jgi:Ca2+-transporting ATPase
VVLAAASLGAQAWAAQQGYDLVTQQSLVFTVLCFSQLCNALSVRGGRRWMGNGFFSNPLLLGSVILTIGLQMALLYIPAMNDIFKTTPLDRGAILAAVFFSLGSVAVLEARKACMILFRRTATPA